MRRIKKFAAIMILAAMASLSAPAASAKGIIMTDNTGIIITSVADTDNQSDSTDSLGALLSDLFGTGIIVVF